MRPPRHEWGTLFHNSEGMTHNMRKYGKACPTMKSIHCNVPTARTHGENTNQHRCADHTPQPSCRPHVPLPVFTNVRYTNPPAATWRAAEQAYGAVAAKAPFTHMLNILGTPRTHVHLLPNWKFNRARHTWLLPVLLTGCRKGFVMAGFSNNQEHVRHVPPVAHSPLGHIDHTPNN